MGSIKQKVYVFSGVFASREEACLYSEPQHLPEPDESASDEEYAEWEDNCSTHELRNNIKHYLDNDFIETIDDNSMCRYEYIESMLINKEEIKTIKHKAPKNSNILVLVFHEALGGFKLKEEPKPTKELTYCGEYNCLL